MLGGSVGHSDAGDAGFPLVIIIIPSPEATPVVAFLLFWIVLLAIVPLTTWPDPLPVFTNIPGPVESNEVLPTTAKVNLFLQLIVGNPLPALRV